MHRNPAALLALDRIPMARLLRACGVDESIIRDGSDYDRFAALCAILPLCVGHPLRESITRTLQESTGLSIPLRAETAGAYWDAWVSRHWYADKIIPLHTMDDGLASEVPLPPPLVFRSEESVCLSALPSCDPAAYIREISMNPGQALCLDLPHDVPFVRPDPYHVSLAVQAMTAEAKGRSQSEAERACLVAQTAREAGQRLLQSEGYLLLRGGSPAMVADLLAYLDGCGRLPSTVWFPADPAEVGAVSGLYGSVRTGLCVRREDTAESFHAAWQVYASVAPRGRVVLLVEKGSRLSEPDFCY